MSTRLREDPATMLLIGLRSALKLAAYAMVACGVVWLGSGVDLSIPVLVLSLIFGSAYGIAAEAMAARKY